MTPDMAVVTPLNNFLGPEGDTVTVDEQLLNTQYSNPWRYARGRFTSGCSRTSQRSMSSTTLTLRTLASS